MMGMRSNGEMWLQRVKQLAGRRSGTTTSLPLQQFSLWSFTHFLSLGSLCVCTSLASLSRARNKNLNAQNPTIFAPSGFPHEFLFYFRVLPFFELLFFKETLD
jgi:hypothetical protein